MHDIALLHDMLYIPPPLALSCILLRRLVKINEMKKMTLIMQWIVGQLACQEGRPSHQR
jgi:hypothetical protein